MAKSKWCDLGVDMVCLIDESIDLYIDKVQFRAVCTSWNSFPPKIPNLQEKRLPWLLYVIHNPPDYHSCRFFDLLDRKTYILHKIDRDYFLYSICGSSHGFVLTKEPNEDKFIPSVYLMNPLTGSRIDLPSGFKLPCIEMYTDGFEDCLIHKFVLSSSPLDAECVVYIIYSYNFRLAYWKRNQDKWVSILDSEQRFSDIQFRNGKLHALTSEGKYLVLENFSLKSESKPITESGSWSRYLVESVDGGLMIVLKRAFDFRLYKQDPKNMTWFDMMDIGKEIIILDESTLSKSISSLDFPGFSRNRIFFTQKRAIPFCGFGIRVYNIADKTVEFLPGTKELPPIWSPPTWFMPS